MKYALLERTTNKILGWYADDMHSSIPINCIEVEDEIWQEALMINANCYENRKFIFKDFRTEKEIEEQRIALIKSKANEIIEEKYPLFKQLNIIRVGGDELEKMTNFIDGIRRISNDAETNKTSIEQISWEIK